MSQTTLSKSILRVCLHRGGTLAVYGESHKALSFHHISQFAFWRWAKVFRVWSDMRASNLMTVFIFGWTITLSIACKMGVIRSSVWRIVVLFSEKHWRYEKCDSNLYFCKTKAAENYRRWQVLLPWTPAGSCSSGEADRLCFAPVFLRCASSRQQCALVYPQRSYHVHQH